MIAEGAIQNQIVVLWLYNKANHILLPVVLYRTSFGLSLSGSVYNWFWMEKEKYLPKDQGGSSMNYYDSFKTSSFATLTIKGTCSHSIAHANQFSLFEIFGDSIYVYYVYVFVLYVYNPSSWFFLIWPKWSTWQTTIVHCIRTCTFLALLTCLDVHCIGISA